MTKEQLIKRLKAIKKHYEEDQEVAHIRADAVILNYINDAEIEAAYDDIPKWYA